MNLHRMQYHIMNVDCSLTDRNLFVDEFYSSFTENLDTFLIRVDIHLVVILGPDGYVWVSLVSHETALARAVV